ncbi:MAG: pantetheine-phosphate adenylyltransferase [Chloroflexota bacterium]|nr:pantetheine-phosphate adenylyltransferase [Chloroflexota bacterium]
MKIALYPGTFDPVTNGHIDIAIRAAGIFDELVMGVYDAPPKTIVFNTEERVALMKKALDRLHNVRVEPYAGLTVDFARQIGAKVIVRGLRGVTDFEYEFQIALMNKKLAPDVEMVCLMTNVEYLFLNATRLKEVAALGADISTLVPQHVVVALSEKFEAWQKTRRKSCQNPVSPLAPI